MEYSPFNEALCDAIEEVKKEVRLEEYVRDLNELNNLGARDERPIQNYSELRDSVVQGVARMIAGLARYQEDFARHLLVRLKDKDLI